MKKKQALNRLKGQTKFVKISLPCNLSRYKRSLYSFRRSIVRTLPMCLVHLAFPARLSLPTRCWPIFNSSEQIAPNTACKSGTFSDISAQTEPTCLAKRMKGHHLQSVPCNDYTLVFQIWLLPHSFACSDKATNVASMLTSSCFAAWRL